MWEYDAQQNSFITAGNGGTKPVQAAFTIFYNQGTARYDLEQTLQPDEQMWIDVGKLISQHVPDKNGNTLPVNVAMGAYQFLDLTNPVVGSLFEGKVIYDKTYGYASYGCALCCGYKPPTCKLNPLGIPLPGNAQNGIFSLDTCSMKVEDVSGSFDSWTVVDPTIATTNSTGYHTSVAVGSTFSNTAGDLPFYRNQCDLVTYYPKCADNVTPTISSISPAQGPIGVSVSVTLNGKGFGTAPTVNAGTGITVTVNSATDVQIQASFAISSTAAPGNQSVTVTAGGQTSNGVNFFVQVPTSLSIVPGTDSTTSESSCPISQSITGCGVTRSFLYQVNDQIGQPIQAGGLQVWDAITTTSPNNLNIVGYSTTCSPANTGPCGFTTDSNGQFGENRPGLQVCAVVCRRNNACTTGGPTDANQTWHVGPSSIVQQLSYYCDHILVNGI